MVADYQAKRQTASWPGLYAERVHISPARRYRFHFSGPVHLLCISEGSYRTAGETRVDDLTSSRCQVVTETMVFVPCGSVLTGWTQRKQSSSWFYIYLDPQVVEPAIGSFIARLRPRLFFNDEQLASTARKVRNLINTPHDLSTLHAQTLAILLGLELLSNCEDRSLTDSVASSGLSAHGMRLLREFIDDHLGRDLQIADLCKLVNLSPYYFLRAFKRSFDVPPHQYIMRCRIERAKRLLLERGQTMGEIGHSLGFASPSHFSTAFKALAGVSPSEYRRSGTRVIHSSAC